MGLARGGRANIFMSGNYEYATYHGDWWNYSPGDYVEFFISILRDGQPNFSPAPIGNGSGPSGTVGVDVGEGGSFSVQFGVFGDDVYSWRVNSRHKVGGVGPFIITNGNMEWYLAGAPLTTFGTPIAGNVVQTQSELNFSCQWFPNCQDSPATAFLYYKKTTDISYTLWTGAITGDAATQTGDAAKTYAATVNGLDDGTSYQFYLFVSKPSSLNPTAQSTIATAATLASTPEVTTEQASTVTHQSAVLNGTLDANFLDVDFSFVWNGSAQRVVDYLNGTNITDGKVLTIGAITYTFLEDDVAIGNIAYTGQPTTLEKVTINGVDYVFKVEQAAAGGKLAYSDVTDPTHGKIVTIPTDGGPSAVYTFKLEAHATGGKFAYLNASNPPAGKTVTVPSGGMGPDAVYTFVSTVVNSGDVKRAGNADATMLNLERAINNAGGTPGAGNDYIAFDFGFGPDSHPLVTATHDAGANEVTFVSLEIGPIGNINLQTDESSITPTDPTGGSWVENDGDVLIVVGSPDSTMLNLTRAINNSGGTSGVGNDYIAFDFGAGPAAHPLVVASHNAGGDEVTFVIAQVGSGGNIDITTDEVSITPTDPTGGSWVEDDGDVLIGANEDATFLNLTRALNHSGGTEGVGEDYISYGAQPSVDVTAIHNAGGNVVDLTAVQRGSAGNMTVTDTSANITSTSLTGGADLPGPGYQVLIGNNSDATMLNLRFAVNKVGGTEGINYVAPLPHPNVVATINQTEDWVHLTVPTNSNPVLAFSTDEPTFTLTTNAEAPYANETTIQPVTGLDGFLPYSDALMGLTKQRTYYYKAKAVYTANGGGTLFGSEFTFTTGAEPLAAALNEEHMQTIQFDGQYGQAKTVTFTLREPSGITSDLFYTDIAPLQADCKIFKDGVFDSTSDNAPVRVLSGAHAIYTLVLSADEMEAETIDVVIHDVSGTAFRDAHIQVRTAVRLSEIDVDATFGPVNATALTLIGNGDGHGMLATSTGDGSDINAVLSSMWLRIGFAQTQIVPNGSKIKLDVNASAVDDFYNGCIVALLGGDGAGQSRVIIDYNGGQKEAVVDTTWSTIPNNTTTYAIGAGARPWSLAPEAELASVPAENGPYGEMLQLLFQRFAFKVEQTASAQTWSDSADSPIFDRPVSDDGVTQTVEKLANI
jgi:hypothetical protein